MARIIRPSDTGLLDAAGQDPLLQQRLLLDGVDVQARADVPRDVAVERPHARVVGDVLQHDVARGGGGARLDDLDVAALGVLLVDDGAVPGADALGQDVEVVPVQVHGVGGRELVLDDEPDGRVVPEVVGVPLRVEGVGDVALVGEDEHGVAGGWRSVVRGFGTGVVEMTYS